VGVADMPQLSVAAVARKLGIAPATLRTWDRRYGIGPADHAPGRHRRYSADDLARLELMRYALLHGATPADAATYALTAPLPHSDAAPPPPIPDTGETTVQAREGAVQSG
jgi:MerR family transcriptional regulator, light-induced transcriptional regulator